MNEETPPNGGSGALATADGTEAPPAPAVHPAEVRPEPEPVAPKRYSASIFPGPGTPISDELASALLGMERAFDMPTWFVLQSDPLLHGEHFERSHKVLGAAVADGFLLARRELADCGKVLLVLDSPGGLAGSSYQIATLLKRHCGGFAVAVPRIAKSAATLLVLGGEEIYLGGDAELGPLDVQVYDPEREEQTSALDEVQALERLFPTALEQVDQAMALLVGRTGKKIDSLMPMVMKFVSDLMTPLLSNIDAIHFTQQGRRLRVAEDYAVRLLAPIYGGEVAKQIASRFVNHYSEHGFIIGSEEASSILVLEDASDEQREAMGALTDILVTTEVTAIGRIREEADHGAQPA